MRKYPVIVIIAAFIIGAPGLAGKKANAAEFRAGLYSYLAWWKPGFRTIYSDYSSDPLMMYGPLLSLTAFDDFNLSALVITNRLNPSGAQYMETFSPGSITVHTQITRLDVDCSLTYRVNNILRVFAGFKKMDFREEEGNNTDFSITGTYGQSFTSIGKNETFSNGPGCGLSLLYPLTANISAAAGTSLVYMWGSFSMNSFEISGSDISDNRISGNYRSLGNNSTLSLSYYIPGISTAIVLGGRFQVLKNYMDSSDKSMANDYYYGLTLSAIYTF